MTAGSDQSDDLSCDYVVTDINERLGQHVAVAGNDSCGVVDVDIIAFSAPDLGELRMSEAECSSALVCNAFVCWH